MKNNSYLKSALICLSVVVLIFGYLASVMGTPNMLNTMMKTAHDLLLNTVFYLMAICVLTGAIGKLFMDFGVVTLLQKILQPLMKPLFNLPGVAALGAVMTFLSDNPAIIGLSKDKKFSCYFKKFQLISLTNFGTAFGMGLIVIVFMIGQGYYAGAFVGLFGAICGCVISTRMMQYFICKDYPNYRTEDVVENVENVENIENVANSEEEHSTFIKILNAMLDGGKSGVEIGIAIIPGVLIISTLVMMLTFGGSAEGVDAAGNVIMNYTGAAYEGTQLLPWLFGKINFLFDWLFGFGSPELVAFPITALGAVGAALGLIPEFASKGIIDGNAIAVCTAMGMCWSGYLSTHTAMLDSLGYRQLLSRAFLSHFFGGLGAGFIAHWAYVGLMAIIALFDPEPVWTSQVDCFPVLHSQSINKLELTSFDDGSYTIKDWYGNNGQDLCFMVNENDSTIRITNSYSEKSGYSFVRISKEDHSGKPAYAAIYPGEKQSEFVGNKDKGYLYAYAIIYDGRKQQLSRGYYELTWGGEMRQAGDAEEEIKLEIEEERAEAIREADSIRQQEIVDSILMVKQAGIR